MNTRNRSFGSACVGMSVLALCLIAVSAKNGWSQDDPWLGTWKLNVAKSKYIPGPPPQSVTLIQEAAEGGTKVTVKGVDAEGRPFGSESTLKFDGHDYPVPGNPAWDTMSVKRVDAYTLDFTRKKAGKIVQSGTDVVAKDGKTRTMTARGVTMKGEELMNIAVFDKQ
jgi:hypothetical protein